MLVSLTRNWQTKDDDGLKSDIERLLKECDAIREMLVQEDAGFPTNNEQKLETAKSIGKITKQRSHSIKSDDEL